jgi:hypothetical protein
MNANSCTLVNICVAGQADDQCVAGSPRHDGDFILAELSVRIHRISQLRLAGTPELIAENDDPGLISRQAVAACTNHWQTMTVRGLQYGFFIITALRVMMVDREPLIRAVHEALLKLDLPAGDAYGLHDDLWENAGWYPSLDEGLIEELQTSFWHRLVRDLENGSTDYAVLAAFAFNCLLRRPKHQLIAEAVSSVVQAVEHKRAYQNRIIDILTNGAITAPELGVSSLPFLVAVERCLKAAVRDGLLEEVNTAEDIEKLRRLINQHC